VGEGDSWNSAVHLSGWSGGGSRLNVHVTMRFTLIIVFLILMGSAGAQEVPADRPKMQVIYPRAVIITTNNFSVFHNTEDGPTTNIFFDWTPPTIGVRVPLTDQRPAARPADPEQKITELRYWYLHNDKRDDL